VISIFFLEKAGGVHNNIKNNFALPITFARFDSSRKFKDIQKYQMII
jgi:hypothetical protein